MAANDIILIQQVTSGGVERTITPSASGYVGFDGNSRPINITDRQFRSLPQLSQTANYTLAVADVGRVINITTGGINVLANTFAAGDQFLIYNNSVSNQTLSGQSGTVLRLAGSATTGSRTIAQYGLCSVLCVSANIFVVAGTGVT
jgi:hypothetical protein